VTATAGSPSVQLAERPPRPIAVVIVAVLAVAGGVYYLVSGSLAVAGADGTHALVHGILSLVLGVAALLIAAGALRVRRWAWVGLMTWGVVGLTNELLRHFFYADPNYVAMAVDTVAVFALTPLDVQVAFGIRPPRNLKLDARTRNPIDRH